MLLHPEQMTDALRHVQAGTDLPQELHARRAGLHTAKTHLLNQRERVTDAYLANVLGLDEYQRRRHELEQRLVGIEQQMHQLDVQARHQQTSDRAIQHFEQVCERVRTGVAEATFAQQRQLVELLIDRVVVTNDDVEIRYVLPISVDGEQVLFYQLRIAYYRAVVPIVERGMCVATHLSQFR
jgi:site-specific DNA recombinase